MCASQLILCTTQVIHVPKCLVTLLTQLHQQWYWIDPHTI